MSAYQNLTTLYRGEPSPFSWLGRTENNMLKGRWFTPKAELARGYANYPGGVIRSMNVTASQLADAQKFKSGLKYRKGFDFINPNKDILLASRKLLSEAKPSINWGQTLKHNLNVSKLAAQLYGPKILEKSVGALSTLGSLPLQAGIMTLTPTTANPDEADMTAEDFRNLAIQERNLSRQRNVPGTPIVPVGAEAYGHSRGVTDTGGSGGYSGPPTRSFDPVAARPQRQTQPGGFTNPGRGSYGPWMSHGGLARILEV